MGFFRRRRLLGDSFRYRFNLGGRWTNLTALLLVATVTIFVFAYGNRPSTEKPSFLLRTISLDSAKIVEGEVWRLFTAPFLFGGMLQLFFASIAIYLYGGYASKRLGLGWFLGAYLGCGAAGGLVSSLIVPGRGFEAAPAATIGIILLCTLYYPYMYFLGGATARQLAPVIIGAILASRLAFAKEDLAYLGQLAALPVAYGVYVLLPASERMRNKRRLRREISDAFTEVEREEHLDRLLKKVAQEGMDSLSRKERHFLQTVSREYRRKKVKNNH
jgi:membrane associated rhomboid family serine protease